MKDISRKVHQVTNVLVQINSIWQETQRLALQIVQLVNIVVVEMTRNVFHGSGNVMVNQIVWINRMNQQHVQLVIVVQEHSNVII
jgi:hypothetical protein